MSWLSLRLQGWRRKCHAKHFQSTLPAQAMLTPRCLPFLRVSASPCLLVSASSMGLSPTPVSSLLSHLEPAESERNDVVCDREAILRLPREPSTAKMAKRAT